MTQLSVSVSDRDRRQGELDAPVVLLEYADYACRRCGQIYPILQEIQHQVRQPFCFAFRHFPLTAIHPMAEYAAEIAEAAHVQGCFWQMHDYLFRHQQSLGNGRLLQFAAEIGLDVDRFEREVAEHLYINRVLEDIQSGISSGVNGTPTFFINGVRHDGAGDLEMLLAAINSVNTSQQI